MVGNRSGAFDPDGDLTLAQAITVASRIHSIYSTGTDAFSRTEPWYKAYVDYAKDKAIISSDYPDYSKKATRAEFAVILSSSLPDDALAAINNVDDNAIPDVTLSETYADAVYLLYRAGIFAGNDSKGTFSPDSFIRRSEVAAVVSRMADSSLRKSIELQATADAGFSFIPIIGSGELFDSDDSSVIDEVLRQVRIGYADGDCAECVTKDVTLPTEISVEGYKKSFSVKWYSNNQNAIQYNGQVKKGASTVDVKLTAKVTYQGKSGTKDFDLTVIKANRDVPVLCDSIDDLAQFSEDGCVPNLYINDGGIISNIDGVISNVEVYSCDDAIKALESIKGILGIVDPEEKLAPFLTNILNYSNSYTLQQMYKGIPVHGRRITVVTAKDGVADFVNNSYLPGINISTEPGLSAGEVIDILKLNYSGDYTYEDHGLIVYTYDEYADSPVLAYEIGVYETRELIETLIVDSMSGEILNSDPAARYYTETTTGYGIDEYGITRYFPVEKGVDGYYYLYDSIRNIKVYDGTKNEKKSESNHFNDTEAVSAYGNVALTHDWYNYVIGINPVYDHFYEIGKPFEVHLRLGRKNNASFSPSYTIIRIGEYDSRLSYSMAASLDVIAHEYSHGVLLFITGDLDNYYEPGAIDEAYADIFGFIIDASIFDEAENVYDGNVECSLLDLSSYTSPKDKEAFLKSMIENQLVDGNWVFNDYNTKEGNISRNIADPESSGYPAKYFGVNFWDYTSWDRAEAVHHDYGGAHHNCTVISHAAYLMHKAGFSYDALAKMWFESMGLGYDDFSKFINVRINVLHAAKLMGLPESHIDIVKNAFDEVNIKPENPDIHFLTGRVTVADNDLRLANNIPLADATVKVYNGYLPYKTKIEEHYLKVDTNKDGEYRFDDIPYGQYTIMIEKEGYLTVTQYLELNEDSRYNFTIEAISENDMGGGNAEGIIYDARTGNPVAGLTLNLRFSLNNNRPNDIIYYSTTTDENGAYSFYCPAGYYTIEIVDNRDGISDIERYTTTSFNVKVLGLTTISNQNGYVSNGLSADEIRIILHWGTAPADLDSHLVGPSGYDSKFHIYYGTMSNQNYAVLDRDDRNGEGPETITIHQETDGTYVYAVHDYSNNSSTYSTALSNSGAYVEVYRGSEKIKTYYVPSNREGTLWTVFSYDSRTRVFKAINEMSYNTSDGSKVLSSATVHAAAPSAGIMEAKVADVYDCGDDDYSEYVAIMLDDILASTK